jgi:hypothetical protein
VSLRPFANLLAVHEPDPGLARGLCSELENSGVFASVGRWHGFIVAWAPLDGPRESTRDPVLDAECTVFAEGEDLFEDREQRSRLAECAQRTPERLASFEGDFGFISVAPNAGLAAVRACGGSVPFYYFRNGARAAVGTRLGFFPRFVERGLRLDPLVAATWAAGVDFFPDGRSLLDRVKVLERGHVLRLDGSGTPRVLRYWQPRPEHLPKPNDARIREHADALRAMLVASLEANLDPDGANLLTLSGGVDSSSLAALSGKLEIPISTLSFMPDDQSLFEREKAHVDRASRIARIDERRLVRLGASGWFDLQRRAPHSVCMVLHPALCLLPELAQERPIRVLFGGEFGDVVCGSTPTLKDWAAHTSALELLFRLRSLPNGRSDVSDWLRYRVRLWLGRPYTRFPTTLGPLIHPAVRAEYAAWARARSAEVARDRLPRPALPLYAEQVGFVAQNWEVCSELGIRRFFPFFTRQALELAYRCHPVELVGPGSKKILKRALSGQVPDEILGRKDKGFWGPGLKRALLPWSEPIDAELSSIIREDWVPRAPAQVKFLDALALQALVNILAALRTERQRVSTGR